MRNSSFSDVDLETLTSFEPIKDEVSAAFKLSCCEMWFDGVKATKLGLDPVSDGVGCFLGTVCCIAMAAANAKDDAQQPATRYEVVHANQIRRNEAAQASTVYAVGLCLGDALVDTLSVTLGVCVGGVRAAFFSCTGNNTSKAPVFGYSRDDLQAVDLFDSCTKPACLRSSSMAS